MNGKHDRTLRAIFADPVSPKIEWIAVEKLFAAIGCRLLEGSRSRVRFECKGIVASFHRPHPDKEAKRYQIRDARAYLVKLGVKP